MLTNWSPISNYFKFITMEKTNPYWYFLYKDRCQKYWYMNDLSVGNITAGLKHNKKQGSLSPSICFLLWFSVVRDFFFPFFFSDLSSYCLGWDFWNIFSLKYSFVNLLHPVCKKHLKVVSRTPKRLYEQWLLIFFSLLILIFST